MSDPKFVEYNCSECGEYCAHTLEWANDDKTLAHSTCMKCDGVEDWIRDDMDDEMVESADASEG